MSDESGRGGGDGVPGGSSGGGPRRDAPPPSPDPREFTEGYLRDLVRVMEAVSPDELASALELFERVRRTSRTVYVVGNGGSAATASHLAADLGKNTVPPEDRGRGRISVVSLVENVPWLTALANDLSYRDIFSEQLRNHLVPGDVLVAVSVSGTSPNVVEAARTARRLGAEVLGLVGRGGGEVARLSDVAVTVPSAAYGKVETVHLAVVHLLAAYLAPPSLRGSPPGAGDGEGASPDEPS